MLAVENRPVPVPLLEDSNWSFGGYMVEFSDIQKLSEKIQRDFKPDKIILFGSYAWGTPQDDSDVDLLVILPYQG